MSRYYNLGIINNDRGQPIYQARCDAYYGGAIVETQYTDANGHAAFSSLPDINPVDILVSYGRAGKWYKDIFSPKQVSGVTSTTLSTDHSWEGETLTATDGTSFSFGEVVRFGATAVPPFLLRTYKATSGTRGEGIWVATDTILVRGRVRDDSWSFIAGDDIYISSTAGQLTNTIDSGTGKFNARVAFAESASIIYFNPDSTTITSQPWSAVGAGGDIPDYNAIGISAGWAYTHKNLSTHASFNIRDEWIPNMKNFWYKQWVDTTGFTDAVSGTGTITKAFNQMTLATGATNTSKSSVYETNAHWITYSNSAYYTRLAVRIMPFVATQTGQTIWVGLTDTPAAPTLASTNHMAFYVTSTADLYASCNDGGGDAGTQTDTTVNLANITALELYIYYSADNIKYYVNGTLVATHTTNRPNNWPGQILIYISTEASADRQIIAYPMFLQQGG